MNLTKEQQNMNRDDDILCTSHWSKKKPTAVSCCCYVLANEMIWIVDILRAFFSRNFSTKSFHIQHFLMIKKLQHYYHTGKYLNVLKKQTRKFFLNLNALAIKTPLLWFFFEKSMEKIYNDTCSSFYTLLIGFKGNAVWCGIF